MTYDEIKAKIEAGFYGHETPNWSHTSVQDGFRQDVKEAAGVPNKPATDEERDLYGAYISAYSLSWHTYRRHSWQHVLDKFVEIMQDRAPC